MYIRRAIILCFICLSTTSLSQEQVTVILKPGPAEGKDVELNDWYPDVPMPDHDNICAVAWTDTGIPFIARSIFKFNLSFLDPGDSVITALLSLWSNPTSGHWQGHKGDNECYLRRIVEEWDENTVTWGSPPQTTIQNEFVLKQSTDPWQDYPDIPVTQLVRDMVKDPQNSHGFMLSLVTEELYRSMIFASSDHADPDRWPELEIIYLDYLIPHAAFEWVADDLLVTFTNLSHNSTTWYWDFGDGADSYSQHPIHSYQEPGVYSVCLYAYNEHGADTLCQNIELECANPVALFDYHLQGTTVLFEDRSSYASEWLWDFGNGYLSDLPNPITTYAYFGWYYVCLQCSNPCGTDIYCDSVHVCDPPVSDFGYTTDGMSVYLSDSSHLADDLQWNFGDGQFSNQLNPIHVYADTGYYTICQHTRNECSKDSLCQMIHITAIEDTIADNPFLFVFYPNPAWDIVYMTSYVSGLFEVSFFKVTGEILWKDRVRFTAYHRKEFEVTHLQEAIYLIRVEGEDFVWNGKLVVIKD